MKVSRNGIGLIKRFEGFQAVRYICPAGKITIGYGHTLKEGEIYQFITEQQAEDLLIKDIYFIEIMMNSIIKVPLTQQQFDAVLSLIYNWGTGNFLKSEGLQKLNIGDYNGAISEFNEVNKVNGKTFAGLVRRRGEEAKLFSSQVLA